MKRNIVVTGATGHVGGRLAELLLAKGHTVTAVVRSADKGAHLAKLGAKLLAGDLLDAAFLTQAYRNQDAAFIMNPPNNAAPDFLAYADKLVQNHTTAVKQSGLRHAVVLSSFGAEHAAGTGPIVSVHRLEQALGKVAGLHAVFLRPGFFMENLLANIGMAQHMNINGAPAPADAPFATIATADIADVALGYLNDLTFTGKKVHLLLGPKDVTWGEITAEIGKAIGKSQLPYVQFTPEQAKQGMLQAGLGESIANLYLEMYDGMKKGLLAATRSAETQTPTTLQQFLQQAVKVAV
jgi:uncharacterized protein YbjT (DUF2867 family)